MARSISWHPRLAEIHRQVSESARTPYTRDEIEKLFRVKKAAAKQLVQLMPRFEQQNSAVVEREDLLDFIGQCIDAEDLSSHLEAIRHSPPRPRRRKLRVFVPRDFRAGDHESLTPDIRFSRNEVNILFSTAQDLLSKMFQLLSVLEDQEFQRRYCDPPVPTLQQRSASAEKESIALETRYCSKMVAARKAAADGDQRTFAARLQEASAISAEIRAAWAKEGLPPLPADDYLFLADAALAVLSPAPPVPASARIEPQASNAPPAAVPTPLRELEDKCA
jgi:hypothetical protein